MVWGLSYIMAKTSYNPKADGLLRVSKSSFMLYSQCPRKYWWQHVGLPDVREPPSPAMIRGTNIHKLSEVIMTAPKDERRVRAKAISEEKNIEDDDPFMTDVCLELDDEIRKQWGDYEVIMCEEKIGAIDEKNGVELVGSLDGVLRFRDDDGEEYIVLVEVKTGNWGSGKLSRTRRELCFYTKLLHHHSDIKPTHFLYITPDFNWVMGSEMVDNWDAKRNKHSVVSQMGHGIAWMEQISPRSINAFMKAYDKGIEGMKSMSFNMKWNDYYCGQYCPYMVQCEPELAGLVPDPTNEDDEQ